MVPLPPAPQGKKILPAFWGKCSLCWDFRRDSPGTPLRRGRSHGMLQEGRWQLCATHGNMVMDACTSDGQCEPLDVERARWQAPAGYVCNTRRKLARRRKRNTRSRKRRPRTNIKADCGHVDSEQKPSIPGGWRMCLRGPGPACLSASSLRNSQAPLLLQLGAFGALCVRKARGDHFEMYIAQSILTLWLVKHV